MSAPTPYYRPELDALRFFAFLCVFAFHRMDYVPTDPVRNPWAFRIGTIGAFGVPVFFLLSAFLITELLLRERERTGRIHIKAFYVRRILRIWPLYFAAFFGLVLLERVMPGVGARDPHSWLAFTLFSGNWWITFHGWIAGSIDPLWSISVEEQFYLVIPLVAAFASRRVLAAVSGLLLLLSYATILWYGLHPVHGDNGEWTNSLVHFQFFCTGTLLALALRGRLPRLAPALRIAAFPLGIACWLTAMMRFHVQSWDPRPTPAGAILGWLLVLAATVLFFLGTLGIRAERVPRWLAYLGRISYGLYVVHSFVFFLLFTRLAPWFESHTPLARLAPGLRASMGTLLVVAVSIALAHLSFQYFEQPFLRLKRRFTFVPAREEAAAGTPSSRLVAQ